MTDEPTPPPQPSSGPDRSEEVAKLVRAVQEQAEEKDFILLSPGPPPRSPIWYGALVLSALLAAYVWIGQPAWLVGETPAPPTEVERERVLRLQMYLQGQQIEAYRRENGELPASLGDAGGVHPGMRYQTAGPRVWELLGEAGDLRLILRSTQSAEEFLGPYEALLGPGGP